MLFRKWESVSSEDISLSFLLLVPKNKVEEALRKCHEDLIGKYFGVRRTLAKVRQRFFWLDDRVDVEKCRHCYACTARKGEKGKGRGPLRRFIMLGHFLKGWRSIS